MSAWGLEYFMTRSGLPCPMVSWRMKGTHQANPNRISQAGIWLVYLDYHTLASARRTCDGKISSHFAFALGVDAPASVFVS